MDGNQLLNRSMRMCVDLAFCIGRGRSMANTVNGLADALPTLVRDLNGHLNDGCRDDVGTVRAKVISFGDLSRGEHILTTPFFDLCDEDRASELAMIVRNIPLTDVSSQGSAPEALALAMRSDWCNDGAIRRHVVVLLTDAIPGNLGEGAGTDRYPENMPASLDALAEEWSAPSKNLKARRLIAVAPECEERLAPLLDCCNSYGMQCAAGEGCRELDFEAVLRFIEQVI